MHVRRISTYAKQNIEEEKVNKAVGSCTVIVMEEDTDIVFTIIMRICIAGETPNLQTSLTS